MYCPDYQYENNNFLDLKFLWNYFISVFVSFFFFRREYSISIFNIFSLWNVFISQLLQSLLLDKSNLYMDVNGWCWPCYDSWSILPLCWRIWTSSGNWYLKFIVLVKSSSCCLFSFSTIAPWPCPAHKHKHLGLHGGIGSCTDL